MSRFVSLIKSSPLRKPFLGFSIMLHNHSYSLIKKLVAPPGTVHPKHRIIDYHKFFIDNITESDSVLDVGCGNGAVAFDVARKAGAVTGIDINLLNIKSAKLRYRRDNLNFILGDATKFSYDNTFDVAILSNVLEHINDRVSFLSSLGRVCPKFLIRVPLITRGWLPMFLKQNGYEYRLDKTHFIEYTEEIFKNEISDAGLELADYYVKWGELYAVCKR